MYKQLYRSKIRHNFNTDRNQFILHRQRKHTSRPQPVSTDLKCCIAEIP